MARLGCFLRYLRVSFGHSSTFGALGTARKEERVAVTFERERLGRLKDTVAVVGVGETDYHDDYYTPDGQVRAKGEVRFDAYTLASRAFRRALDDCGLQKSDIDGL